MRRAGEGNWSSKEQSKTYDVTGDNVERLIAIVNTYQLIDLKGGLSSILSQRHEGASLRLHQFLRD